MNGIKNGLRLARSDSKFQKALRRMVSRRALAQQRREDRACEQLQAARAAMADHLRRAIRGSKVEPE
jgi:hypothetical protein